MDTFGRYQLQEKLGQGGMGVVYRAFDTTLERTVALKLLLPAETLDADLKARLFREARSAGNLKHRNVVTIYDLGEHEGRPYLAMELLDGEDLQRRLSRPEKMSLQHKIELSIEICDGLAHAHAHGVVHRDIKPANIFITEEGAAKLLDFGLARLVTSQLTRSNMLMGTLNYMAPEQVRGERADHRSDIFSTGVVLYELFGGRKAFEGDSVASTLYKILQEVPEPLLKINASLPQGLASIVERMLAKLPDERYPDMDAVRRDLGAYRPDDRAGRVTPLPSPIVTAIAPASDPLPATVSAPRRLWPAGVIAAAIVAVAVAGIWILPRRSPPAAPVVTSPAPPPQRNGITAPSGGDAQSAAIEKPGPASGSRQPEKSNASAPVNPRGKSPAPGRSQAAASAPPSVAPRSSAQPATPEPAAPPPTPSAPPARTDRGSAPSDVAPAAPATGAPPPAVLATAPPISVPAAGTPTAPPPPPETPSAAVAEQHVTELLDRYKQALESRNIDQLKRIWPSLGGSDEAAIRQEFQHASRITVTIDRPEVSVSGSAGRVNFIRNYSLVTVDGQRLRSTTSAVMNVRRNGNAWVIDAIRFTER
jgi:serine/threonine-protein kinase